jgi:hypothetical protein
MLPQTGIKLVSVVLHSHLAGKKLRLRHIRQGRELPRVAEDDNYDFNYQQARVLLQEVSVLPGDELVTECVYQTPNRTEPTFVSTVTSKIKLNNAFSLVAGIIIVCSYVAGCLVGATGHVSLVSFCGLLYYFIYLLFSGTTAQRGPGPPHSFEVCRSQTMTHHSWYDSSGRGIGLSQRPLS